MAMFGFGLKLGCQANIDLTFDDEDEIREHPMVGQFADSSFTDLIENLTPFKRESLSTPFGPPTKFNAEKIAAMKAEDEEAKRQITFYEHMQKISDLIMSIDD
jgi:hypothetical protein